MHVIATNQGRLLTLLHAAPVEPSWAASSPSCLYDGDRLQAVRCQVSRIRW